MKPNKIEFFNKHAPILFKKLIDDYGFTLEVIETAEMHNQKWSAKHVYIHALKELKIEIRQEPYYTDYGFSIFIYNLLDNDYNILYNIPHEKQDDDNKFLSLAADDFFSCQEVQNLLQGKWKKLN